LVKKRLRSVLDSIPPCHGGGGVRIPRGWQNNRVIRIKIRIMKQRQCTFKMVGKERYTQGWVDAKKIKNAETVQILEIGCDDELWEVLSKGDNIKEKKEINHGFKNNYIGR
jgi:hypothetical protein